MKHSDEFENLVNDARGRVQECSVAEAKAKMDAGHSFHLIDVREESEWARGHLPGAKHLSKGIIERDVVEIIPEKGDEIVLYCGGGFRSALAGDNLRKMGYTNVISMDGGYRGWNEAGYEVEGR